MGADRLLIVDDESTILVLLRTLFEHRGVPVCTAENGPEALEMLRAHPCAVMLVDKQMPLMGGLELIEVARREWPDLSVVLMTAYPDALPPDLRLDGYLAKPFKSLAEVENVVNNAFQARLRRQHLAQLEQTMARMRVR